MLVCFFVKYCHVTERGEGEGERRGLIEGGDRVCVLVNIQWHYAQKKKNECLRAGRNVCMYVHGRCVCAIECEYVMLFDISRSHTYIHSSLHAGIRFFFLKTQLHTQLNVNM